MSHGLFFRAVETGAFENNVNTDLAPRKIACFRHSVNGDLLAVYRDRTGSNNGLAVFSENRLLGSNGVTHSNVITLGGIVLQEVSEHLRAGEVVDSNNFIAFSTEHLTECETTDTAETVNGNFY